MKPTVTTTISVYRKKRRGFNASDCPEMKKWKLIIVGQTNLEDKNSEDKFRCLVGARFP